MRNNFLKRLLVCLFITALPAAAFAQISVSANNQKIKQVLLQIEKNSGYHFFYSDDYLDLEKIISINVKNESIESALNKLFKGTDITYRIKENKQIALLVKNLQTPGENKKAISGTIVDDKGEAIIGASVVVKGTTNGTATDVNGKFSLDVPANAILQVSYIGYAPQDIPVGNQSDLSIRLNESSQTLDEVVVVGYGVQKKRDLTGAVSSIKVDDAPVGTFSTISHALAGKAAGLQVTQNSAQVGAGASFRIRGATSTGAGNEPLVIIDGIPISGSSNLGSGNRYDAGSMDNILESINPNDIESIEVLKDASSTAIYGSRAGHGVIIVTTKRGKAQKVNVTYSGNASVQNMKNGYKLMSGPEYMTYRNRNDYETHLRTNGLDIYADYITPKPNPPTFVPRFSDQDIAKAITTNWVDEVTRQGYQQSHNVSLAGGTESTKYMASLNYFNQQGVVKNNGMSRFTAKVNLDQQISKYVRAGLSFNANRNQYDNVPLGGRQFENAGVLTAALESQPQNPVYDEKGDYYIDPERSYQPNAVSLLEMTDKSTKDRLLASVYTEVEPIKGLIFKAVLGADRQYAKRKNYIPKTTLIGAGVNGQAAISQSDRMDYLMDLTATFSKEIDNHNFTILGGYSYQQFNSEGFNAGNSDFLMDIFLYNNLGAGGYAKPTVGSNAFKSALGSYFGRLNYSFMGKYLLTATVRTDGASNFDPNYRWGTFPSASVGWRFSDEDFMSSLSSVLSNGKLRVGYGQTGNSNVGNRILDTFGAGFGYVFGDSYAPGIRANQLGNPKLTWETTTELNIGLDLGFFDNRISTSFEYYDRTISDLLVTNKALLSYNEISSIADNIGKTQGRGFEWTLNTVNITNKDLFWSTDLSFSLYRDRWKERAPDWKPASYESADDPIRSTFLYLSDGVMQAGEKAPVHQAALLPGQVKLKDLSGPDGTPDGVLNDYDRVYIGSSDPKFLFGFNNTLKVKNFDFNIYFYGAVGALKGASYYESVDASIANLDRWYHDNRQAKYPSTTASSYGGGDYYHKEISYLRCRNITLGYVIPLPRSLVSRMRVYGDVNNPFIITNWTGIDPETEYNNFSYPNAVSFSLGIDITF